MICQLGVVAHSLAHKLGDRNLEHPRKRLIRRCQKSYTILCVQTRSLFAGVSTVAISNLSQATALQTYFHEHVYCLPHNNLLVETNFSHAKRVNKKGKGRLSAGRESELNQHLQNVVYESRDKSDHTQWKPTKHKMEQVKQSMHQRVRMMEAVTENDLKKSSVLSAKYFQKFVEDAKKAKPSMRKAINLVSVLLFFPMLHAMFSERC